MYALVLVLNMTEYLEDVLEALVKSGVTGATIIDSQGMGSALMSYENVEAPIFGSLKTFFDREHPYNKTIFTIVESEELLDQAIESVRGVVGDLDKPNEGLLFTVPLGEVLGLRK